MSRFIEIERHTDLPLAEIAKAKLESENIFCYLHSKNHIAVDWRISNAVGGVKLLVLTQDYEKAKKILSKDESFELTNINFPEPEENDLCKKCGSEDLKYISYRRYSCAIMLLGIPLLFWGGYYKCKACGYKIK